MSVTRLNTLPWESKEATPVESVQLLGVDVAIKRDDLNHPIIQGNKLRKLKYNVLKAFERSAKTLVTFGGAYSNHLLATAYAAKQCGFKSLGFVRGDELKNQTSNWSETLSQCHHFGMELTFVSRSDYGLKEKAGDIKKKIESVSAPFVIPEGGSNRDAIKGMSEIIDELNTQLKTRPSHVFCPVGTGGTFTGLVTGVTAHNWDCKVYGISVLKSLHKEISQIEQWLKDVGGMQNHVVLEQFNGGGFAKNTQELAGFGIAFEQKTGIALDKIYNTKSFYALAQLIKTGEISANDKPLIIHTGGIQGGVNSKNDINK